MNIIQAWFGKTFSDAVDQFFALLQAYNLGPIRNSESSPAWLIALIQLI